MPDPDMTGHLGNLGADLIQLGELQLELLAVDARDATREAYVPAFLAFFGSGLLIGSCPLALWGLAYWLDSVTALDLWSSSLIIATVGLALASGLFFFAYKGFKRSFALINRSRAELHSNLEWIKRLISQKHQRRRRWPL